MISLCPLCHHKATTEEDKPRSALETSREGGQRLFRYFQKLQRGTMKFARDCIYEIASNGEGQAGKSKRRWKEIPPLSATCEDNSQLQKPSRTHCTGGSEAMKNLKRPFAQFLQSKRDGERARGSAEKGRGHFQDEEVDRSSWRG